MKKELAIGLIAMGMSGHTMADSGPGCGIGSMIFAGQSGLGPHVLAATTNGTFGNQTFGMSTGTLGCNPNSTIINSQARAFLENNMEKVAFDMSRGEGEAIKTLAGLLEISDVHKATFYTLSQQHFTTIFANSSTNSEVVLHELISLMRADEILSQYTI